MRRVIAASGLLTAVGTVPLVVVVLVFPGQTTRALDAYVVFLGAVLLLALVRITPGERPRTKGSLGRFSHPAEDTARIVELDRLERDVVLATGSELEQHVRINPLLRDVVEDRLWRSRGLELERDPERAREALGDELFELVKPGRPDPNARYFRGLDLPGLHRILDRIEAI
jgi:hypothetical protein